MIHETVQAALTGTNWTELAAQKAALVDVTAHLQGRHTLTPEPLAEAGRQFESLLGWMDAVQDAAQSEGYPVVFQSDDAEPARWKLAQDLQLDDEVTGPEGVVFSVQAIRQNGGGLEFDLFDGEIVVGRNASVGEKIEVP